MAARVTKKPRELAVGDVYRHPRGIDAEVLSEPEQYEDMFGRPMIRFLARRLDTDGEGTDTWGPDIDVPIVTDPCFHDWQVQEDGYTRVWSTSFDQSSKTIHAAYNGSEDFTEDGSGELLRCTNCQAEKPIPEGWTINWV